MSRLKQIQIGAPEDFAATIRTGADLVAYWRDEGLIGTRPDIDDPQQFARDLRSQAECRDRASADKPD